VVVDAGKRRKRKKTKRKTLLGEKKEVSSKVLDGADIVNQASDILRRCLGRSRKEFLSYRSSVLREACMAHAELALSRSGPSEPESFNQQQYGPFKVWTEACMYHAIVKRIALQDFLRVNQKDDAPILKGCSPDIHHRFGGASRTRRRAARS
jgi:hypothetical protein